MSSPKNRRKMSSSHVSLSEYTRNVRSRRNLSDTDTVDLNTSVSVNPEKLKELTFAQCKAFYTKNVNPLTNEQLDANSFKAFKQTCDNLILKGLEKWKQTPFVDPFDDTPIIIHENNIHYGNNKYRELYNLFFMFLLNNQVGGGTYLTLQQIIEMLPVEHQLFNNQFDILAYEAYKQSTPKIQHKIYEVLVQNVKKIHIKDIPGYEKYNNAEVSILYILTLMYANAFANYVNYVHNILRINDISTYGNYVKDIKEYIEHIKVIIQFTLNYDVIQTLHRMINDNVNLIMQELNVKLQANIPEKTVLVFFNHILSATNYLQDTLDRYTEIYNIYNYKNNPKQSPFVNLNNTPFGIIEDPLVKILNKIGVKEIDMSSLELPTRLFANDAEYNKYYDKYSKLKNEYITQMEKWNNYDDNPTLSPVTKPVRPNMLLPNGRKLDVILEIFPRHINDAEYERMKQVIEDNQHIIDAYKPYLDKKLLEILSEADISIDKNGIAQLNLVDRDREYFLQNVLYDGSSTNDKCVDNTDGIDYTNFDNNYLLSRLQLMFQLKTYNKNNEVIRIDCFYAPNFYNYIVRKMLNNEPIKNPVTRNKIKSNKLNNVLDELMKIMNFIDIHIPRPYFVKPPMDINLYIEQSFHNSQSGQQFTRFRICRRFSHIVLPILHLCVIPNDINPDETGSTNICSGVFASNMLTLFDKGRLLHNYLPPYHLNGLYIKPMIHFNNFAQISFWEKPRNEQITMFKNYSNELQNFIDE